LFVSFLVFQVRGLGISKITKLPSLPEGPITIWTICYVEVSAHYIREWEKGRFLKRLSISGLDKEGDQQGLACLLYIQCRLQYIDCIQTCHCQVLVEKKLIRNLSWMKCLSVYYQCDLCVKLGWIRTKQLIITLQRVKIAGWSGTFLRWTSIVVPKLNDIFMNEK
jgi:hypothetical protein